MLTKTDALNLPAMSDLMEEGLTMKEARPKVADAAAQMLSRLKGAIESQLNGKKYPPKAYLPLASE